MNVGTILRARSLLVHDRRGIRGRSVAIGDDRCIDIFRYNGERFRATEVVVDCRTSDSIWRGGERINRPINASSNICYRGDRLSWTTKKADVSNDRDNDLSTPRSLSSVREETPTLFSLPSHLPVSLEISLSLRRSKEQSVAMKRDAGNSGNCTLCCTFAAV